MLGLWIWKLVLLLLPIIHGSCRTLDYLTACRPGTLTLLSVRHCRLLNDVDIGLGGAFSSK